MSAESLGGPARRPRRITLVIPSFNHAQFIGEAIASVFAQTHADIDLHVIDDGSTDGSARVIEQALAAAPSGMRCEFSARANRGCSATLNELISGVRTEWVAILNSDDILVPSRFEQMLREVPEEGHYLGFSAVEFLFREGVPDAEIWREFYPAMFRNGLAVPTVGFSLLRANFAITSSNFLFDRTLFDRVGGFREDLPLSQDWDFLLRALQHVEPTFHPELLLRYRVHANNTYRNHRGRQRTELRLLFESFGDWASGPVANCLAPTPRNWPRLFPVFSRFCRLGTGEPIGSLLPADLVRPGAHRQDASQHAEGFEAAAIRRLLSGGPDPGSAEGMFLEGLARSCQTQWSAIRDLVTGREPIKVVRDALFSWFGSSVRVASDDVQQLRQIGDITGLVPTLDAHDATSPDLQLLDDRTVRLYSAERTEEKTFGCHDDLNAWLALSVSDLLAARARLTLVHAASFVLRGGVVLLCGDPWSGKSTYSLRALESGFPVLGDDQVWIDPADGKASPCPRPIKRRIEAGDAGQQHEECAGGRFEASLDGERSLLFPRGGTGLVPVGERHPVRWVVHLCRRPDPGLTAQPMASESWRPALRSQLRNFSPRPDPAAEFVLDALSGAEHLRLFVGEGEVDAAFRWMLDLR